MSSKDINMEECTSVDAGSLFKPLTEDNTPSTNVVVTITTVSDSPTHCGTQGHYHEDDSFDRLLPTFSPEGSMSASMTGMEGVDNDPVIPCRPNSPLLQAVQQAVESLNPIEDFEILDQIGSGFYAEVFKVRFIGSRVCTYT